MLKKQLNAKSPGFHQDFLCYFLLIILQLQLLQQLRLV